MAQTDISLESENTLLGQLFLPCDMYDSYKALFSDKEPHPEHVATATICLTTN